MNAVYHMGAYQFFRMLNAANVQVNCIVTSPPYWGLRDYQSSGEYWPAMEYLPMIGLPPIKLPIWEGELGAEPTVEMFIGHLVLIFREARAALADDGVFWLNLGDSYGRGARVFNPNDSSRSSGIQQPLVDADAYGAAGSFPNKQLVAVPWRAALALQADGWILRCDIVWSKTNSRPESVRDRVSRVHEYIFLFSKSESYWYDSEAIREPAAQVSIDRAKRGRSPENKLANGAPGQHKQRMDSARHNDPDRAVSEMRNKRSVWNVATSSFRGPHFATFPEKLIEPAIKAGCVKGGVVCDPFFGAGTSGVVAQKLGRRFIGCDVNAENIEMATMRIQGRFEEYLARREGRPYTLPLFEGVAP